MVACLLLTSLASLHAAAPPPDEPNILFIFSDAHARHAISGSDPTGFDRWAQTYRDFPAWRVGLINTETRDSSQVSFSAFDRRYWRTFASH